MRPKTLNLPRSLLYCLAFAALLYIFFRFLLPWTLPFLIALAFAAFLEPAVCALCRRGLKRPLAAGVCVLSFLSVLGLLLWLLCARIGGELGELTARAPEMFAAAEQTLRVWQGRAQDWLSRAPEGLQPYLERALAEVGETLARLPAQLSGKLFAAVSGLAAAAPGALLFTVTLLIGTYFISASYPELLHGLARILPEETLYRADRLRRDLRGTFGRWLRAQGLMLLFTFFVLAAAFFLLRIRYALLLSVFTALVDALPVFGVGTVLLPWALYDALTGAVPQAVGLVITYLAAMVLRQCVQAKLIGDQLGLHPLAALAAIYVGWKTFGVWGMLLAPVLAVVLRQLLAAGVFPLRPFD